MPEAKPPLHERANTYFFLTAALGGLGVLPFALAQSEVVNHHNLWGNGWFRLAAVLWLLAFLALLWGIGLYSVHAWQANARGRAEREQEKQTAKRKARERDQRALDNRIVGLMAKNEQRKRDHAAEHWTAYQNVGRIVVDGTMLISRTFGLSAPTKSNPIDFHDTSVTCEVWRGAHRWRCSSPLPYRYNMGHLAVFPYHFDSPPGVPEWWLDLRSGFRIIWQNESGEVLSDELVLLDAVQ